MQHLKKLISVIQAIGEKNILVFEKQLQKAGKELKLFQGIYNGEFKDEHQAARSLYQSSPKDKKYGVLKSRLEDKLLNFLMVIEFDQQGNRAVDAIENRCKKLLYQVNILIQMGEQHIAERLLYRILQTAKAYEFTAITVESLELLLELYTLIGNTKHYQRIKEEFILFRNILFSERSAKLLFQEAQLKLVAESTVNEEWIAITITKLQDIWEASKSFTCFNLYYRLYTQKLKLEQQFHHLYELTTFADTFVKELKINNKRFDLAHNQSLRIYSCLRTGEIEMGLQLLKDSEPLYKPATDRWLVCQENYFLLLMQKGDYSAATKVIEQLNKNPFFDSIVPLVKERWFLYSLYLNWMQQVVKVSFILENTFVKQHLSICSKDKQGYNIAILILQFCHYLDSDKKDILLRKSEIYKKYVARYIDNEALNRERIIFLFFQLIIRHEFHYEKVYEKSNKLLMRLNQCVLPGGSIVSKIEIIPYSVLCRSIMDTLSKMRTGKSLSNSTIRRLRQG